MHHPFGEWEVKRELGRGDFATVYLVEQGGRQAALKACTSGEEAARQRFQIEVEALSEFDHLSIPKLLEVKDGDLQPYFVMELAPGQPVLSIINEWQDRGRVFGEVEALEILGKLLRALEHIHGKDRVHRDIKDANVIVDVATLSASIIDFGFCKRSGTRDIRTNDSFWRAGSARFAPPAKLLNPGYATPSHDVFAIGVLGYRMLTGYFPWSVGAEDDVGPLREAMETRTLVSPSSFNSSISLGVSRFISRMLTIDDQSRPNASDAAAEAVQLLEEFSAHPRSARPMRTTGLLFEHVWRDNLQGDVALTDYEYRVLNSREMQRLRWIKQLGLTNLVFAGAEHTRILHSVGTLNRVETMIQTMENHAGTRLETEVHQTARLYALTHDICHIPMGHTIEDELGMLPRHDENSERYERLVGRDGSDIGALLRSTDIGRAVLDILNPAVPSPSDGVVVQAVSGVVGADVLDYIDRDSMHCGLDHRVDSAILRHLRLHERPQQGKRRLVYREHGKFGIRVDRQFAVESLLLERYALFLKVYMHSAKIAADAVLGKALAEVVAGSRPKALRDEHFDWLGDDGLLSFLETLKRRPYINSLADRLRYRALPKAVFRGLVMPNEHRRSEQAYQDERGLLASSGRTSPSGRREVEERVAKALNIESERVFFYLPAAAPGYRRAEHWAAGTTAEAPIRQAPPRGADIAMRHLALWEAWAFVLDADAHLARLAGEAVEEVTGYRNVIQESRHPGLF
jgi:HD superfamily phosphohydrolase/predicted Ser/Thr protein kinase